MWTMTKNKITDFCDQIMMRLHLNTRSILKWYAIVLFVAPLLFWGLLEFRVVIAKISLFDMLRNQPTIAISVIVAITDFILGYYCWLEKDKLISCTKDLKIFWICQCFCQLLVGNLVCLILSLFGLRALRSLDTTTAKVAYFKVIIIISTVLYALCILLLGLIGLKGLRG